MGKTTEIPIWCALATLRWLAGIALICRIQSNKRTCSYTRTLSVNLSLLFTNRGSYMSANVLLNLLNELGKRDKMRGLLITFSQRV